MGWPMRLLCPPMNTPPSSGTGAVVKVIFHELVDFIGFVAVEQGNTVFRERGVIDHALMNDGLDAGIIGGDGQFAVGVEQHDFIER